MLTAAEGAELGDTRGTGVIADNDPAPVLTISTPATVGEGQPAVITFCLDRLSEREPKLVFHTETGTAGAPADYSTVPATVVTTISLGTAPATPVNVTYRTLAGTAQPGSDFSAIASEEVIFAAGATIRTVTVVIPPGADHALEETFALEAVATLSGSPVTVTGTGHLHPFAIRSITAEGGLIHLTVPVASDAFTLIESSPSLLPDSWSLLSAGTEPGWQEITVPAPITTPRSHRICPAERYASA